MATRNYEECPAECVYRVDFHDLPDTSGYSMALRSGNWVTCMRIVAQINQKELKPCLRLAVPGKLSLFEYTKKEREGGHQ